MFSPRIALVGALSSAAALAFTVALALPASAAPFTAPGSIQCFQAESNVSVQENTVANATNTLSNDTVALQKAKSDLSVAQAAVPVVPTTITAAQNAVNTAQLLVNTDQASLRTAERNLTAAVAIRDTACGNATPTTTPVPTPTPAPGPVGLPGGFPNCTAAFAAGVSNIPSTDSRYRRYLDRDRDGVACELNGNDGGVVGDNVQYRVINGKKCHQVDGAWVPVTVAAPPTCTACSAPPPVIYQAPQVVAPAPVFVAPAPVYSAPIVPSGPAATGR